ncbi:MAG: BPTD_3080 family restriction endonuclease [Dehalococcoidia bacterium]
MVTDFFEQPILNSPYAYPERHWELDDFGQPTGALIAGRRGAKFIVPIPKAQQRRSSAQRALLESEEPDHRYDPNPLINNLRTELEKWRRIPNPSHWNVTPETARLLQHWRTHEFSGVRPFYCQIEAVETAIWLTEVAPQTAAGRGFLDHLRRANGEANPELVRLALKLATGAGKTTVMAMLIAWQAINAARRPTSNRFTRGFLIVTPGITIKDRLRVLQPNDPDSYFKTRELVPPDMLPDLGRAKIVITNYHAFKLRERMPLASGTRALLRGRGGDELDTRETEGQMVQRVMGDLMGMKNILALNDEAHHCYREKPGAPDEDDLTADDRQEAKKNNEEARLWISGLEMVKRKVGLLSPFNVIDLSATPFFLRGSGYKEGTLFPWTMSDFSLMDAIECGVVKLPRVPIADNIPGQEAPMYRNLWANVRDKMPKKGRAKAKDEGLDPESLPTPVKTALEALYGHYEKTFRAWEAAGTRVHPCFIVVCQNTSASKLVFDFISGYTRKLADGTEPFRNGAFALFRNFDDQGTPLKRPNTLLIDSEQLEAGEALSPEFKAAASDEIERFKRERIERSGDQRDAEIPPEDLLREVMNTVGKEGQLGESIRCVVSVSMLTEGWDANTVTHVLGLRAFGTQLLCEQVIGRALRRQSYDLNDDGLFNVEYADVLGIPFDFNAKPVVAATQKPRDLIRVFAVSPERDACEIRFPRVAGYRVDLPEEQLSAAFTDDSILRLTPELTGPTITRNAGILGEAVDLNLIHTGDLRVSTLLMHLTKRLIETKWRDPDGEARYNLYGQLKRIAKEWLDTYLVPVGNTYPAQLMYAELADMACERITAAIVRAEQGARPIRAVVDPYNPEGSTAHVRFTTSQENRWQTAANRCHVNWAILDSNWEAEMCRVLESHPRVHAYVKNHNLGFEVPYQFKSETKTYKPDYIVQLDDGHGGDDLLNLVVEVKGFRGEDAKDKKLTMETYWVPGVNNLQRYGRWAFAEFTDLYTLQSDFEAKVEAELSRIIDEAMAMEVRG